MTARPAYLRLTLAAGEARPHVPCHLDCLVGAARPAAWLDDGGPVDQALGGRGRFRARGVFSAARSLGRVGQQAAGFTAGEEVLGLSRSYLVELPQGDHAATLDRLRGLGVVESAGPELFARATWAGPPPGMGEPTRAEAQLPFDQVGAPAAQHMEPGDPGTKLGVVDTGVALGHPELAGRLLAGYDFVDLGLDDIPGGATLLGDASLRDDVPEDEVGHGTHVTGVIGAVGSRVPHGVAGECRPVPLRVLAGARTGSGRPFGIGSHTDIDAAVKMAVDTGAAVVNLSLGTPSTELDPQAPLPHTGVCAYAESRGTVLVAASGNDGTDVPFYPAANPTVLAVGAVDRDGSRASFSSHGPHVRVHAPGVDIVGLSLHGYRRSTGTSHAAPFVSGAAALVVSLAARHGAALAAADVRSLLTESARPRAPGGPDVLDIPAGLHRALDHLGTTGRSGP
jgi:subtilisin family serine protease